MKIHRYQLIRKLGRGGMGSVFLARDTRLGRLAAIKFLSLSSPTLIHRFLAEARATALCSHENIVIIYDVGQYGETPYMALEYLEGQTLRQMMKQARAERTGDDGRDADSLLSVERAVEIAIPMVRALQHAHNMGIVHRDLKPGNVMLTNSGTVKVLDFGIAKVVGTLPDKVLSSAPPTERAAAEQPRRPSMTRTGALVGTLPYMSPEQLRSRDSVDPRSDIWAVGIMLFEMVTGRHPLAPLSKKDMLTVKNRSVPMPSLSARRPDLREFGQIVDRCLLKRRAERMASAAELLAELTCFSERRDQRAVDIGQNPFTGLATFQEVDARRFFGRTEDVAEVVARVRSQAMVAVVGPSGVGKSSLVRAGVIPALKRSGEGWQALIARPGRRPLDALADLLLQLFYRSAVPDTSDLLETGRARATAETEPPTPDSQRLLDSSLPVNRRALRGRLSAEPGFLGAELRGWAERRLRRVLVFIDEFEELYTLEVPPAERAAFMASLIGIADDASSPLRVIVSMRADFLERMAESREFMAVVTRGLIFLPPIGRAGLRSALVEPARAAGYRFESESVIESMLDALDETSGALPLLQFTAASLWDARDRRTRLLTKDSYLSIGGLAGALARHADSVIAGMSTEQIVLTQQIFKRLVTPERTRAVISVSELRELSDGDTGTSPGDVTRVLQELAAARLVVIETGSDGRGRDSTVEVVHESLIEGWPTLDRWLDENRDDVEFVARIRTAANQWIASGEAEGMLWRGTIASEARRFSARYQGALSTRERRFLAAVFALRRRASRRKRLLIGGLISGLTVLVVAAAIGLLSLHQSARASRRHADREIRQCQRVIEAAEEAAATATGHRKRAEERARRAEGHERELRDILQRRDRSPGNASGTWP